MVRRDFFRGLFAVAGLPEVKSAEILRLESNDTIVFTLQGHASQKILERVHAVMASKFPGHKILVKDSDIDISIIKSR